MKIHVIFFGLFPSSGGERLGARQCGVEDAPAAGKWYFAAERESSARSGFAQGNPIRD